MVTMENEVILYNRVNDRLSPVRISLGDFLNKTVSSDIISKIRNESDKKKKYQLKRNNLKAVSFEDTDIIVIDIDGIENSHIGVDEIINEVSGIKGFYFSQETVSGNIALYFKYDRGLLSKGVEFWRIYYKLWLTLTATLDIDIDYLPEQNRLRYISGFEAKFSQNNSVIDTYSKVATEPYVNTNGLTKKGDSERKRSISYGSGAPIQIDLILND